MNREDLFQAVGDIDPAFIEEAAEPPRRASGFRWWKAALPAAACAAIVLGAALYTPEPEGGPAPLPTSNLQGQLVVGARPAVGLPPTEESGEIECARPSGLVVNPCTEVPEPWEGAPVEERCFQAEEREILLEEFGASLPIEELLPFLQPEKGQEWGLYRAAGGQFAVSSRLLFSGAGRTVAVTLSRGLVPADCPEGREQTELCGREVTVSQLTGADPAVFLADWQQNGTHWSLRSEALTEEELEALLTGLVQANDPGLSAD